MASLRSLSRPPLRSVVEVEINGSFLVPSRKPCTAMAILSIQSGSEWIEYYRSETVFNSTSPSFQKPCYICDYHFKGLFKIAIYDVPMKLTTAAESDATSPQHLKKTTLPSDTKEDELDAESCYGEMTFQLKDLFSRQTLQIARRLIQPLGLTIPSGFVQLKGFPITEMIGLKIETTNLPPLTGEYFFRICLASGAQGKEICAYRSEPIIHPHERGNHITSFEKSLKEARRYSIAMARPDSAKKTDSRINWKSFFLSGRWIEDKQPQEKLYIFFINKSKVVLGDPKLFSSTGQDGGTIVASYAITVGELRSAKPKSALLPLLHSANSSSSRVTGASESTHVNLQMECSYHTVSAWKPTEEKPAFPMSSERTGEDASKDKEGQTIGYAYFLQKSGVALSFPAELSAKATDKSDPQISSRDLSKPRPKSAAETSSATNAAQRAIPRPVSSDAYQKRFKEIASKKAKERFDEENREKGALSKSEVQYSATFNLPANILKRSSDDLTSFLREKDTSRNELGLRMGSAPSKSAPSDSGDKRLILALEKNSEDRVWEDLKVIYDRIITLPCLQDFTRQQQLQLSRVAQYIRHMPGDTLFDKGDNLNFWYLILEGEVTMQRTVETSGPGNEWLNTSTPTLTSSFSLGQSPIMKAVTSRKPKEAPPPAHSPLLSAKLGPPELIVRRNSNATPTRLMKSLESETATVAVYHTGDCVGEMYMMHHRSSAVKALVTKPSFFFMIPKSDYDTHFKNSHLKHFNEYMEFLKSLSIFEDWSRVSLARLASVLVIKKYSKGESIIKCGQTPSFETMYFIQSGSAMLYKFARVRVRSKEVMPTLGEDQRLRLEEDHRPPMYQTNLIHVADIHKGDFFGQLALLGDPVRDHQFTVTAKEDLKVFALSRADCQRLFRLGPDEVNRAVEKMRAQIQKYDQDDQTIQRIFDEKENERRWALYKKQLVEGILHKSKSHR